MAPEMILLIAKGCPHCASVLQNAQVLIKDGLIGHLEVFNLSVDEAAQQRFAVRSVPWFKIGDFEFSGAYRLAEMQAWAEKAAQADELDSSYIQELLEQQQLDEAVAYLQQNPQYLKGLLPLMKAEDLSLSVKLGISAIMESLADEPALQQLVPDLIAAVEQETSPAIRADLAHFLGLSGSPDALPALKKLLNDADEAVREIAQEGIERIQSSSI